MTLTLVAFLVLLGERQNEIYQPEGSRHIPCAVRRKPRHMECACYFGKFDSAARLIGRQTCCEVPGQARTFTIAGALENHLARHAFNG